MGASLFVSCRKNDVSRTHEEIAGLVNVSTRSLCKALQRFGQDDAPDPILMTQLSLAERMMDTMKLDDRHRDVVLEKIRDLFAGDELEHTPKVIVAGIIAGILLKTTPEDQKQLRLKDLSKLAGVSVVSIQKILKKI